MFEGEENIEKIRQKTRTLKWNPINLRPLLTSEGDGFFV